MAIKCLNEGVDIPPLRIGFFLSSSSNPREFIQRRGRLLRRCNGKNAVDIYDFIVTPNLDKIRVSDQEMENIARITRKELERVKEFNNTALNRTENEISILKELDLVIY